MVNNDLTPEQIAAIKRGIELGRTLQRDHPEIVELWRKGCTLPRIVEKLKIISNYRVSNRVAAYGVRSAIAGSLNIFGVGGYAGLIDKEERETIAQDRLRESGHRLGRRTYEQKKGIHGLNSEQRKKYGRLGGKIGGRKAFEEGRGIHGQTPEQRKEYIRRAVIGRGMTSLTEEERGLAYEFSQNPYFRMGSLVRCMRIAQVLNGYYHNGQEIRTAKAVGKIIYEYRKSLENKAQSD